MSSTVHLASINFTLLPETEALVPLSDIDMLYGYGVYETLKVRKSLIYFPEFHCERLFDSARIIGIRHQLDRESLIAGLEALVAANGQWAENCNLKLVLLGRRGRPADLYMQCLPPLFPDKKELRSGASAVLFFGERHFPAAKSLSMLLSTIAFRKAQEADAYDALLINKKGDISEGTRTNIFYFEQQDDDDLPQILYTPPAETVLNGITRRTIIACAQEAGIEVREKALPLARFTEAGAETLPSVFMCSTSTRILGVKRLLLPEGEDPLAPIARELALPLGEALLKLQTLYKNWQANWAAQHGPGSRG